MVRASLGLFILLLLVSFTLCAILRRQLILFDLFHLVLALVKKTIEIFKLTDET